LVRLSGHRFSLASPRRSKDRGTHEGDIVAILGVDSTFEGPPDWSSAQPCPLASSLSAFDTIDDRTFHACIAAYNETPRKYLACRSPAEVLLDELVHIERDATPLCARDDTQ